MSVDAQDIHPTEDHAVNEGSCSHSRRKGNIRFWLIWIFLGLVTLTQAFQATCLCVAFPTVADDFDTGLTDSFALASVFLLAMTVAQPFGSVLASIFGIRPSFLLTQGLFITGTTVCALSRNSTVFMIGRVIQGVGAGAAEPVKAIILLDLGDLGTRARDVSYLNLSWLVGIITGPLVGGYVVEQPGLGWHWVFWFSVPFLAVGALGMLSVLLLGYGGHREATWVRLKRVNLGSLFAFGAAASTLFLGLTWGGTVFDWDSPSVLSMFVASVACCILLIVCEKYATWWDPIFPSSVFGLSTCLQLSNVFVHGLLMWIVVYFMAAYYLGAEGMGPLTAGVRVLPFTAMMAPAALVARLVVSKTGHYRAFHLGGWIIITVVFSVLHLLGNSISDLKLLGTSVAAGIGFGVLLPSMWTGVQATIKKEDEGQILCATWIASSAGQTLGLVIGSGVFSNKFSRALLERGYPSDLAQGLLALEKRPGTVEDMNMVQDGIMVQAIADTVPAIWIAGVVLAALALVASLIAMCPCLNGAGTEGEEETVVDSSKITGARNSTDFWIHLTDSFLMEEGSETGTLVGSYLGCFEYPEIRGDPRVPPTIRLVTDKDTNS